MDMAFARRGILPRFIRLIWCTGVYFVIQGVLKVNNGMRISRPLMGLMFNVFVMINVMDGVKYPVQQQLLFCIAPDSLR